MVDLAANGGEPGRASGGASAPARRRGQLGPAAVRPGGHGQDAAGVHGAERVVAVEEAVDGVRAGAAAAPPASAAGRAGHLDQHQRETVFPLDIGFAARVLALCALPRRDPGDLRRYKRVNGPYRLVVVALGDQGLPWGSIPRLALAWLCTNVVRKRSRVVELGSSFERFFVELGYPVRTGGQRHRHLKIHVERLFSAAFYMDVDKWAGEDKWERNVEIWPVSKRVRLWTSRGGRTAGGWTVASIELSEPLYEAIIERPFPINLNAIKALRKSPLAIDLYLWLTFRMKGVRRPLRLSWAQLCKQFSETEGLAGAAAWDFARRMRVQLARVVDVWPEVRIRFVRGGLLLMPSQHQVARRPVKA